MSRLSRSVSRLLLSTNTFTSIQSKCYASTQITDLKEVLRNIIPKEQKRVSEFKAKYKDISIGQV
ncbi:unnamed protein product, partial [Rotaria sp. Silwood1]